MKRAILITASACILAVFAFAAPGESRAKAPEFGPLVTAIDRLDLEPSQREKIRAVLATRIPAAKPKVAQLVAERRTLREIMRKSPIDEPAIRAQSAKVAAVESDLAIIRAETSAQVRVLLRPEQVAELQKLERKLDERIDERLARLGRYFTES